MPRARKLLPRYLSHPSGRARAVWNTPTGRRERMMPGEFNSPESLQAFARFQLELASTPERPVASLNGPTVVEVLVIYLRHAAAYYGTGRDLRAIKSALKVVREHYGLTPATDFGPKKLAACREAFVRTGWSRPYVNRQVQKILRAFKWAVAEEIVPPVVLHGLQALAPLRRGHCEAPEPEPRLPANPDDVDATIPLLASQVRPLVELIRLTGMRPSEVCRMSLDQIDRAGPLWLYRPDRHKGTHRGSSRTVAIGAAGQRIINSHLESNAVAESDPLFSPRRQRGELKSRAKPQKRTMKTSRTLGNRFNAGSLSRAVAAACDKAGVPRWSPYQLRHLKGAERLREGGVHEEFGSIDQPGLVEFDQNDLPDLVHTPARVQSRCRRQQVESDGNSEGKAFQRIWLRSIYTMPAWLTSGWDAGIMPDSTKSRKGNL